MIQMVPKYLLFYIEKTPVEITFCLVDISSSTCGTVSLGIVIACPDVNFFFFFLESLFIVLQGGALW